MDKEEQLHIEKLRNGSYLSFKFLYDLYVDSLYGYTLELTRSKLLANELVQDTFVKVWINRSSIRPELRFKSFLFRIAKNQMIDEFRKKLRDPLFEDYLFHQTNPLIGENQIDLKVDFDDFNEHLRMAKKKLTPRQREVFELRKEQGYSTGEIAERFQITEQTVYNQLYHSIQILQKEMGTFAKLFILFFIM
jgi:RNA polymerase sigma factor (sigma-70 family)